jgi:hypothetical protein
MNTSKVSKSYIVSLFLPARTIITFSSKVKKIDKLDGPEADKTGLIKLEFLMDPDNPASGFRYS